MRRPPRDPFALEGLRQHRQADGISHREQAPNANPNRRAICFSSIVSLRVNVSTQAERIRSPERGERGVRRRRKGFAYASSVSGRHPDNVIAFAMVCCCTSCDNSSGAVVGSQPQPLGA
jgi:hypothetical protein